MKASTQEKLLRFMRGRYGQMDFLNKTLLTVAFFFLILNLWLKGGLVLMAALVLLVLSYWRFFSKKIYARAKENQKWYQLTLPIRKMFRLQSKKWQDHKTHRYYHCPDCKQTVRVPKGKGKINITCPHCHNQFQKKT